MKWWRAYVCAAVALAFSLGSGRLAERPPAVALGYDVAAVVNGVAITRAELEKDNACLVPNRAALRAMIERKLAERAFTDGSALLDD